MEAGTRPLGIVVDVLDGREKHKRAMQAECIKLSFLHKRKILAHAQGVASDKCGWLQTIMSIISRNIFDTH